jgi:hypothetical protein
MLKRYAIYCFLSALLALNIWLTYHFGKNFLLSLVAAHRDLIFMGENPWMLSYALFTTFGVSLTAALKCVRLMSEILYKE